MPATNHPDNPVRAWLAAVLRGETPRLPATLAVDPPALLATAGDEGVAALCHHRLRASGGWDRLPPALRDGLTSAAHGAAATALLWERELQAVLGALAAAGIPTLLLKGAALAYTLYPEPYLRPRADADLLAPSRAAAERGWHILQAAGYERPNAVSGDLISYELLCRKPVTPELAYLVDLHWRPSNTVLFGQRLRFPELAAEAIAVPGLGPHARGLEPVHALLLASVHRIAHLPQGDADRLIWLYDIHLLARGFDAADWARLTTLAEEKALCGSTLDGLRRAATEFATAVPGPVLERLAAGARQERFDPAADWRRWRHQWREFRALPSAAARWRWLGQNLFPPGQYMRREYGFRSPLLLPWFYAVRMLRAAGKLLR